MSDRNPDRAKNRPFRALLVYPLFPKSYWGQEYTHPITGRRAVSPPLGLITVAALLPKTWELRLVDVNVEALTDDDLAWADVVMLGAMRIQRESFHDIVRRAHASGKPVVAGGPYVTTDPAAASDADFLVLGEAEETLPDFAQALEEGRAPRVVEVKTVAQAGKPAVPLRPDVTKSPAPRLDLLKIQHYNITSIQFSRGCPFDCEFCDIIEIFGRRPRTKTPAQVLAELDALYATRYRGPVFLVDDNFIGNKKAAKGLLLEIAEWQKRHDTPFDFFTQASINLADDDDLIASMIAAGFSMVFVGIETPSREALLETNKRQNVHLDLGQSVEKLAQAGLQVTAGFIVGFDSDDETIFDRQHDFIMASPIATAMVGILFALPGTQLWRRLESEGRLYGDSVGDAAYRPNFATAFPEEKLVAGYRRLLERLYAPHAYFERASRLLELLPKRRTSGYRRPFWSGLKALFRSFWIQGVRGKYRSEYWRFLLRILKRAPGQFSIGVALAIVAEHMIRYTFEDVTMRLSEPPPSPGVPQPVRGPLIRVGK